MARWQKFPNVTRARLKEIKGVVAQNVKLFFACTEKRRYLQIFQKPRRYNASNVRYVKESK